MGTMTANWLSQLAPDHPPPPPSWWWPLAPGWWGLIIMFVSGVVILTYWLRHPTRRLKRAALRELKHIENTCHDDKHLALNLEHLLRRYAIRRFGKDTVAQLCGEQWVAFIIAHGGKAWEGEIGKNLLRMAYGGNADVDRTQWINGARHFLQISSKTVANRNTSEKKDIS